MIDFLIACMNEDRIRARDAEHKRAFTARLSIAVIVITNVVIAFTSFQRHKEDVEESSRSMNGSDILHIEYNDTLGALLSCVSDVGRAVASAMSHAIHTHTCLL